MPDERSPVALFLGSGFSAGFGLPTTRQMQARLLQVPGRSNDVLRREHFISKRLDQFWRDVFGWAPGLPEPTLEDHFTQIDLAANSGHCLGRAYPPKVLRALRRFSIHRVFKILDTTPNPAPEIDSFLKRINNAFRLSIVTTNWDIMIERGLQRAGVQSHYGVDEVDLRNNRAERHGTPLLRLHGAANWAYCDCCRSLITFDPEMGQVAVHLRLLLEPEDLCLFRGGRRIARDLVFDFRNCRVCGGRWSTRVATFSYRKDLNVRAFQAIWDEAHTALRTSRRWLFVGYSLPEADVEIRHLLKVAQLARKDGAQPAITVVLNDDQAGEDRYRRYFGHGTTVFQHGLNLWITEHLDRFCASAAVV